MLLGLWGDQSTRPFSIDGLNGACFKTFLWYRLVSDEKLVETIANDYEVDAVGCEHDLLGLLEELVSEGLVEVQDLKSAEYTSNQFHAIR